MEGHLQGMLDRDQRTAKLRFYENYTEFKSNNKRFQENSPPIETNQNKPVSHCAFPRRTSPYTSYFTNKKGHIWNSIQRLKHILIVGAYLTLLAFPTSLAAPTNIKMSRLLEPPKWVNPCGISETNNGGRVINDSELLQQIITSAELAYDKAKKFKDEFLEKTFNMKNTDEYLKEQHYDWLPTLPKDFGENVPSEHLKTLKIDDALLNTYRYLQTIAVGLEQVVWDQKDRHGKFEHQFADAELELKTVLCELQMAIIEHNLTIESDVSRDVMDDSFRNLDTTSTKTRDWIIYRDYMNCLEYINESFGYLKSIL